MSTSLDCAKSIFVTAIEKYQPHEWPIFLDGACGDDQHLRAQVEELLDAHREVDSFLDKPTAAITDAPEEKIGTKIGSFKLLQKIGEGGFGVVYMAEQMKPIRRKVALKIIKPGMVSKDVIARFEAERQAMAMMDHPNIAKVLDAGTTEDGSPYFAMELVKGVSLTEYADNNHLATKERLQLFAAVCRAVHHAHQKGVIHRDLKPSNVMVTLHDGKPVCKVIDFGVSKAMSQPLTEQTLFTRYGQVIGTPQYMSPEQAEMSGLDVDTRSDIYSLGVILYELLTGRTPFLIEQIRAAGFDEMRRMIREQDPVRPSNVLQTLDADTATTVASNRSAKPDSLQRMVRGELDWIVMRSLEKDRNRRYDSASSLADDVDRHLNDEPVEATPPSLSYNLWKAYRRHRGVCLAGGSIAAALLIATGISLFAMQSSRQSAKLANAARVQAVDEQQKAETAREEAESQRLAALFAKDQAASEAKSAKQSLTLLLSLFSKADSNPTSGKPYTVREAMLELSEISLKATRGESDEIVGLSPKAIGKLKPETAVELNMGLSAAFRSTGSFDRATLHSKKALEYLQNAGPGNELKRAECLRYTGFYNGDESEIRNAIAIERDANSKHALVASLTLLGKHLEKHDKTDEAIEVLRMASDLFEPHNELELDEVPQFYLARIHRRRLHDETPAQSFDEAAVQGVLQSLGGTSESWLELGQSFKSARKPDHAELALLTSLSAEGNLDKGFLEFKLGQLLLQLCKDYEITSELGRATFYLKKSLDSAPETASEWGMTKNAYDLAEALIRNGELNEAVPLLQDIADSRLVDFGSGAITLLELIAIENQDVEFWLAEKEQELEKEFAEASEPADVKSLSAMLGKYALIDDDMDRCMELLGKGGYSIFTRGPFPRLSFERGYPDSALSYSENILEQYERRDRVDSEWRFVDVARKLYHNGNYEAALAPLREAVELSGKRNNTDEFLHYWVCCELGLLLRDSSPEEAKALFTESAAGLAKAHTEGRRVWWHEDLDRAIELHCQILSSSEIDESQVEMELKRRLAFAGNRFPAGILHEALADLRLKQGQPELAIEPLECSVMLLDNFHYSLPVWTSIDRLAELYQSTGQLERGRDFLSKQISTRDQELPKRHPRRAFFRLHLAEILLAMEGQQAAAKQVLEEAKAIFDLHEIIPDHVHEKVAALLEHCFR